MDLRLRTYRLSYRREATLQRVFVTMLEALRISIAVPSEAKQQHVAVAPLEQFAIDVMICPCLGRYEATSL